MEVFLSVISPEHYFFNPFSLPLFVSSSVIAFIGAFFCSWSGTRHFNRCAAGVCWVSALWIVAQALMTSSLHTIAAHFWAHVFLTAAILFPVIFLHLVIIGSGHHIEKSRLIRWLYAVVAGAIVFSWHPEIFSGYVAAPVGIYARAGIYFFLIIFFVAICFSMLFLTLLHFHAESQNFNARRRVRLLMMAALLFEFSYVDLMVMYDATLYPFGYITMGGAVLIIFFDRLHYAFGNWGNYRLQAMDVSMELSRVTSRLRIAEQKLTENSRISFLANLSAGILHQISQPVMAIYGFVRFLKKEMNSNDVFYRPICLIEEQTAYLKQIVDNLNEVAFHKKKEKVPVSLNDAVIRALNLIKDDLRIKNIRWSTEFSDNLPTVRADSIQLQQVLLNILVNAMQAMVVQSTPEKQIFIKTVLDATTGAVRVVIRDNGPGIDDKLKQQIFEPYYTTRECGTGIGLAFCRDVVTDHGGTIDVASKKGEGAEFSINFPSTPL